MTKEFHESLSDLRVSHSQTHTVLCGLVEKVNDYIETDNLRYKEFAEFRLEASRNLASTSAILKDMKTEFDHIKNIAVPTLQSEQASQKATLRSHNWLIRAIIGVTLLSVLGGTVTSIATCNIASSEASSILHSTDADIDGNEQ